MTTLLTPRRDRLGLTLRDLTDPAAGPHALQTLLGDAVRHSRALRLRRQRPTVPAASSP